MHAAAGPLLAELVERYREEENRGVREALGEAIRKIDARAADRLGIRTARAEVTT